MKQNVSEYIRLALIEREGLTVTEAAKLLGVARPVLSNILNGKMPISKKMAEKFENKFGISAKHILAMQSKFDEPNANSGPVRQESTPLLPPSQTANDIESWATKTIEARNRLPVFIRTLVNSTTNSITKIDFPGNDDGQRPGWDGYVVNNKATAWVPAGRSGWELSTAKNIQLKFESDYKKRSEKIDAQERKQTTLAFVIARRWSGKDKWAESKKQQQKWKDVVVYDSNDLEQWLEQSPESQFWFAKETDSGYKSIRTLDNCWNEWANNSTPKISWKFFESLLNKYKEKFENLFSKPPAEPITIAADSVREGLAFLSQVFEKKCSEILSQKRDKVFIFDKAEDLQKLSNAGANFIAVVTTEEAERELTSVWQKHHTILVYASKTRDITPDFLVGEYSFHTFNKALEDMDLNRDDIKKYQNESGLSLTVLWRRLSAIKAIQKPKWSSDDFDKDLIAFVLIGAWDVRNESDQEVLKLLSEKKNFSELTKKFDEVIAVEDTPLWSARNYQGVVSKIDTMFAIKKHINEEYLNRYFNLAEMVLGEYDPALDLPLEKRIYADVVYNKKREFSSALRKGMAETLVLLSVHSEQISGDNWNFSCELRASALVKNILLDKKSRKLSSRNLEANDRDLPTYAEAVPNTFLKILENDLETKKPKVFKLLRPTEAEFFSSPPRCGLLWALELLAWNPDTFLRVVRILIKLSEIDIDDNRGNKPIESLLAIFRSWMPQTAATPEDRIKALKNLKEKHPKMIWRICMNQLHTGPQSGHHSVKPTWRSDAYGFGEPYKTNKPIMLFVREVVNIILTWENYNSEMFADLIARLRCFHSSHQDKICQLIKNWAKEKNTNDEDRAIVRNAIRNNFMAGWARLRAKKHGDFKMIAEKTKSVYHMLEPSDLLQKHLWLFENSWLEDSVEESVEALAEEKSDYKKLEQITRVRRIDALKEIKDKKGIQGIAKLSEMGNASSLIGYLSMSNVIAKDEHANFILEVFPPNENDYSNNQKNLVFGTLAAIKDNECITEFISNIREKVSASYLLEILILAPFCKEVWAIVDTLDATDQNKYWEKVPVNSLSVRQDDTLNEAVERLLLNSRPRSAFYCAEFRIMEIDSSLVFKMLREMLNPDCQDNQPAGLDSHHVIEAFESMNKDSKISAIEKAKLEFSYFDILTESGMNKDKSRISSLAKEIQNCPEIFVQAIGFSFMRADNGKDPDIFENVSNKKEVAERNYSFLSNFNVLPGYDENGELDAETLLKWVEAVRKGCSQIARLDIADYRIGELLSNCEIGKDNAWPCEPVREILESINSDKMMQGVIIGKRNARGAVFWSGEGGEQERELERQYKDWANIIRPDHPFVAAHLLDEIAGRYKIEAKWHDDETKINRRLRGF